MKRSSTPSWLLDRSTPWLARWQELVPNWMACWSSVGLVVITSADGEHQAAWDLPTDLELQKA